MGLWDAYTDYNTGYNAGTNNHSAWTLANQSDAHISGYNQAKFDGAAASSGTSNSYYEGNYGGSYGEGSSSFMNIIVFILVVAGIYLFLKGPTVTVLPPQQNYVSAPNTSGSTSATLAVKKVTADWLNLRQTPDATRNDNIIRELEKGTPVTLLGPSEIVGTSIWVKVEISTGTKIIDGWVNGGHLQ